MTGTRGWEEAEHVPLLFWDEDVPFPVPPKLELGACPSCGECQPGLRRGSHGEPGPHQQFQIPFAIKQARICYLFVISLMFWLRWQRIRKDLCLRCSSDGVTHLCQSMTAMRSAGSPEQCDSVPEPMICTGLCVNWGWNQCSLGT